MGRERPAVGPAVGQQPERLVEVGRGGLGHAVPALAVEAEGVGGHEAEKVVPLARAHERRHLGRPAVADEGVEEGRLPPGPPRLAAALGPGARGVERAHGHGQRGGHARQDEERDGGDVAQGGRGAHGAVRRTSRPTAALTATSENGRTRTTSASSP